MAEQQIIKKLIIKKLRNLQNVQIEFAESDITFLMGPNGNGKTTILQALACSFNPLDESNREYRFPNFFPSNNETKWQDTKFEIEHSYSVRGQISNQTTSYYKQDRWIPKYSNQPKRFLKYIKISDYIPEIELLKGSRVLEIERVPNIDDLSNKIIKNASYILNRDYESYDLITYKHNGHTSIGVKFNGNSYAALSMSAGEQRIFKILSEVFASPKYSLILIDELDLFLHDIAVHKLIEILSKDAEKNKKQIIVTSHYSPIAEEGMKYNIRNIFSYDNGVTICLDGYSPDAIKRLNGKTQKIIDVFVEDDLSKSIVSKISLELGIRQYIAITKVGVASNAFTVAAGLALNEQSLDNSLFILDGDVYIDDESKRAVIKKLIGGDDPAIVCKRDIVFQKFLQYSLPLGKKPEEYLVSLLNRITLDDTVLKLIQKHLQENPFELDTHNYFYSLYAYLGINSDILINFLFNNNSIQWQEYIKDVRDSLEKLKEKNKL